MILPSTQVQLLSDNVESDSFCPNVIGDAVGIVTVGAVALVTVIWIVFSTIPLPL